MYRTIMPELEVVDFKVSKFGYTRVYRAGPEEIDQIIQSDFPLTVFFVENASGEDRARAFEATANQLPLTPGIPTPPEREGLVILKTCPIRSGKARIEFSPFCYYT